MRSAFIIIMTLCAITSHSQKIIGGLNTSSSNARYSTDLPDGAIYFEGFENCDFPSLPSGWTTFTADQEAFKVVTAGTAVGQTNENGFWNVPPHGLFAASNDDVCNCDKSQDRLVSPAFDLRRKTNLILGFKAYQDGSGGQFARVDMRAHGLPWVTVYQLPASSSWKEHQIEIPSEFMLDGFQFRFFYSDGGEYASGLAIDDIIIYDGLLNDVILSTLFTRETQQTGSSQFPQMLPESQARFAHLTFSGEVHNATDSIIAARMRVRIRGAINFDDTGSNYLIAKGSENKIRTPIRNSFTPYEIGDYVVRTAIDPTSEDDSPQNNQERFEFQVTDSIYSQLALTNQTNRGVWLQDPGDRFGSAYFFYQTDTLSAVYLRIHPATDPGTRFRFKIFSYDTLTSSSYSSPPIEVSQDDLGKDLRIPLNTRVYEGKYLMTIEREAGVGRLIIGVSENIEAVDSNALSKKTSQDWKSFPYFPMLRLVMKPVNDDCSGHIQFSVKDESCPNADDGAISTTIIGANEPFTYNWSNGAGNVSDLEDLAPGLYDLFINDALNCFYQKRFEVKEADTITISPDLIADSCARTVGAAFLNIGGGAEPYIIQWEGDTGLDHRTDMNKGTYELKITDDQGCSIDTSIHIPGTDMLGAAFSISSPSCNTADGSVSITPFGTAPFTFEWITGDTNDTLTSLPSGIYNLTITDSIGCQEESRAFLNDAGSADINIVDVNDVICFGTESGSIDLSTSGGNGNLSFAWSNGANALDLDSIGANTYQLTVTDDSSCKAFIEVDIKEISTPMFVHFNARGNYCLNDSLGIIEVLVSGGNEPYAYSWNMGSDSSTIDELSAGFYTVSVEDNEGCIQAHDAEVSQGIVFFTKIDSVFWDIDTNGQNDGKIYVSTIGGTPPFSHIWNDTLNGEDLINAPTGEYTQIATDQLGCVSIIEYKLENGPTEAAEVDVNGDELKVFPNPVRSGELLTLKSDNALLKVQLIDVFGRVIISEALNEQFTHRIQLNQIPSGTYILQISHTQGFTQELISVLGL